MKKVFKVILVRGLFVLFFTQCLFPQNQSIFIFDPLPQNYEELVYNLSFLFNGDIEIADSITPAINNYDVAFVNLPYDYPFSDEESTVLINFLQSKGNLCVLTYFFPGLYERDFWNIMNITNAMYFQAITEVDSLVGVDSTFAQNIIINESFINPDLPYVEGDIFPVLWAYRRDYPEFPAIYEVNNRPFKAVIDLLNFCSNFELLKQLLIYFGLTVIPVELTSFTASDSENESKLEWTTATEINNQGFEVQRKTSVGDFAAVGFIEGKGTTTEQQNYSFIDKSLSEGKYSYRLKQIDFDGSFEYSKTIEVEIHNPLKFSLSQNYPNPFNPSTKISWQSPVAGWQTLKIYDVLGNLVTTLVDEYKPAGSYEVEFKSTVGSHQLANGIYFYQLKAGNFVETKKMILLK